MRTRLRKPRTAHTAKRLAVIKNKNCKGLTTNMIRKILLLGIAVFSLTNLFGQSDNEDSLVQDSLKELIIIAPNPPYIEIGTYSRIGNFPLGIHFGASRISNRDNITIDFATNGNVNQFYKVKYSPNYIFRKSWLDNIFNPYIAGIAVLTKSSEFNRFEFANSFNIRDLISINIGVWTDQNFKKVFPSLGLKKFLYFDRNCDRLILNSSYFEFKTYFDKERIDWNINYWFELYSRNYRCLSGSIGYESIFDYDDFVLQLSYKHYFVDRKAYNMK
ncbi:MAG: hypothetical protein ACLFT4_10435 [Bacteroidales bacterium]